MLFLLCHAGEERFAIPATRVIEVLPLVEVKPLATHRPGGAGLLLYRGSPVVVLDLSQIRGRAGSAARLSTRIVMVSVRDASGRERVMGLIAERATETIRLAGDLFSEMLDRDQPCQLLSRIAYDRSGVLRWLDVDRLLSVAEGGMTDTTLKGVQP